MWFQCKSGKVISIVKRCNWLPDCELGEDEINCGTCEFNDHTICGYTNESTPNYFYKFSDDLTLSIKPIDDISIYSIVANGKGSSNGKATLRSPLLQESFSCKFFLFYLNLLSNIIFF